MFDVVCVLLDVGPVFMVHCLVGVDDAVDCRDVVQLELQVFYGGLLRAQMIPES